MSGATCSWLGFEFDDRISLSILNKTLVTCDKFIEPDLERKACLRRVKVVLFPSQASTCGIIFKYTKRCALYLAAKGDNLEFVFKLRKLHDNRAVLLFLSST